MVKAGLIKRGFPELENIKIYLEYKKCKGEFLGYGETVNGGYYIDVHPKLGKKKVEILQGGMAHELAHISRDSRYCKPIRFLEQLVYDLSETYRIYDEQQTDLLVVQRGLGEELLSFMKFHDKKYKNYKSEDGLTVNELTELLKSKSSQQF